MDVKFIKESAYIGEALEGDDARMLYDNICLYEEKAKAAGLTVEQYLMVEIINSIYDIRSQIHLSSEHKVNKFHTQVSRLHVLLTLLELQFQYLYTSQGITQRGITDLIQSLEKKINLT